MSVRRRLVGTLIASMAVTLTLGMTQSASAIAPPDPDFAPVTSPTVTTADGVPLEAVGSATEETLSADGTTVLATREIGSLTEDTTLGAFPTNTAIVQPESSGTGGSTSLSGCRKVTVHNVERTLLGFTAYWYNTWTQWCWTRSTQTVRNVTYGWYISHVSGTYYWRGNINQQLLFYDYSVNDGHPRSAFKHYRQGNFDNCIINKGCILTFYPTNTLRSYYNGTWAWSTN